MLERRNNSIKEWHVGEKKELYEGMACWREEIMVSSNGVLEKRNNGIKVGEKLERRNSNIEEWHVGEKK